MKLIVAAAILAVVSAWAQEPPAPPASEAPPTAAQDLPVEQEEAAPPADYGGPAILSRGGGPSIGGGDLASLRPFITLSGVYDSGLGPALINPQGNIPYTAGYGLESMFGVTGAHSWKESSLDLDYRGTLREYDQNTSYNGMDNSLILDYKRRINSRVTIVLDEDAAHYQRAYSLPLAGYYNTGFNAYDPTFSGMTTNDLLDTPTTVLMTSGRLIYQESARLSFSMGGSGFLVRRSSSELIGSEGYTATGDMAYRVNRYQTLSVSYDFNHYDFQNAYGQSDIHGVALGYSLRMGRNWELALSGGGFRIESLRLTQVQLDPLIAALLGTQYGVGKFYGVAYVPRYGGHLMRTFHHASASLAYDRTVLAGNGVYMTSSYQHGTLGYTYSGFRRLTLQAGANYSELSALTQSIGRYRDYSGGAGFTYKLVKSLALVGRFDARRYNVEDSSLNHIYYRAVLGLGWTPGEYPLALW